MFQPLCDNCDFWNHIYLQADSDDDDDIDGDMNDDFLTDWNLRKFDLLITYVMNTFTQKSSCFI